MRRGFENLLFVLVGMFTVVGLMLIGGCAKKSVEVGGGNLPTEVVGNGAGGGAGAGGAAGTGVGEEALPGESGMAQAGQVVEGRTSGPMLPIYFDFDSYTIKPEMRSRLEDNARFLQAHPGIRIEIQGNCDERGTAEYNLALGEKRARVAKEYLVDLGIDPNRITVVSFGEERPLDPGHNESAWAKNRRDDFVIVK